MSRGLLHVGTVFLSSLLLFLIQPMLGKNLLPWFGGSAGVWTTAMLFFQVVLLLGYLYAHWANRWIHLALLAASCLFLPIMPSSAGQPAGHPSLQILLLLARSIGLPYFLLASTSPLVQSWLSGGEPRAGVYRLYALSNLASLGALLLYPVIIEPWIAMRRQLLLWSIGYGLFVALSAASALRSRAPAQKKTSSADASDRLLWIALAACPSVLWLAMANTLSQNLAPVPLLWVLPLGIYLLSLVLCFDHERWYRPGWFRFALPVCWLVMGYGLLRPTPVFGLKLQVALFAAALFLCSMFCHGELARRKPPSTQLTEFYVMLAIGGAIGGVFVGVIAPNLFDRFLELPIGITGCMILAMRLLYRFTARHVARLTIVGAAAVVLASQVNDAHDHTLLRTRNFYGALQVSENAGLRVLSSGVVQHGSQFADPERGRHATAYYGPNSGAALAVRAMQDRPLRVALIGLGAGALATYARPGDVYRFYELNPMVIQLARTGFRYLSESQGQIETVADDGRLALAREPHGSFDLVILDAFSGDSIPVHLLTREAFALYFDRLKPDGIVAVHITNRYVDLEGVVRSAADHALVIQNPANPREGINEAVWVLLTKNRPAIDQLKPAARPPSSPVRVWTDDYSNLFQVLR